MKTISRRLPSGQTMATMSFGSCLSGSATLLLHFRRLWTCFSYHISLSIYHRVLWWYFNIQTNIWRPCLSLENNFSTITWRVVFFSSSPSVLSLRHRSNTWGTWCHLTAWNQFQPRLRLLSSGPLHTLREHCGVYGAHGILPTFHQRLCHHNNSSEQTIDERQICLVRGRLTLLH